MALKSERKDEVYIHEEMYWMFIVTASFASFAFLLYFVANWRAFYLQRRLLSCMLSYNIFDDDSFSNEHVYQKYWLLYTRECVFGSINGFPTIVRIDTYVAKHTQTRAEIYVFVKQFKETTPKTFSILLENNYIPGDIKEKISDFVLYLKDRGYEKGDLSNGEEASSMLRLWT